MKCSYGFRATGVGVGTGVGAGVTGGGGRGWGRRRRRRRRRRGRNVAHHDDATIRDPLDVCAHAFRDDADRHDDGAAVDLRRNVKRTAFAVDDDFRTADGHFYVGTGLRDVNRLRSRIVRNRRAHLLEHRAERDQDGIAAHQRGEDAVRLQAVRLRIDVPVVEEDRDLAGRRRAEVSGRHRLASGLSNLRMRVGSDVALRRRRSLGRDRRRTDSNRDERGKEPGAQSFHVLLPS